MSEGATSEDDGGGEVVVDTTPATSNWDSLRSSLPTELKDNTLLDAYGGDEGRGLAGLVQDHVNVQHLIGGEKIARPGKDAAVEDWDRFYNEMGRPETSDQYDVGEFVPPEGLPWDQKFQDSMLPVLHEAGLSNAQVNKVLDGYAKGQNEQWQEQQGQLAQAGDEAIQALKTEWGTAYDTNVELANRAFLTAFGESADEIGQLQLPDGYKVGDHPAFVKAWASIGQKMQEGTFVGEKTGVTSRVFTPDQAKEEIEKMENNPEMSRILMTKDDPEHKAARARWEALYGAAFPEDAA